MPRVCGHGDSRASDIHFDGLVETKFIDSKDHP